jgi:hypothetical protein
MAAVRSFVSMGIMHCLAVELLAMLNWVRSALGRRSVVPLPIIEVMVDMTIEVFRAVEPGSRTDEHAACEPFRAVIAVRSTGIRRLFIVSIRANGRCADLHGYLCGSAVRRRKKQAYSKSR